MPKIPGVAQVVNLPIFRSARTGIRTTLNRLGWRPTPLPTTPSPVLYVSNQQFGLDDSGRYWLRGNDHKRLVLKGINIPLLDDHDFPVKSPFGKLEELAKTGANCVRIQWYAQYPGPRPSYTTSDLDRVLEKCRTSRLVPIVELHDCTCKEDPGLVNSQLMSWWTRPDVLAVLKRHERYLIINLANELGWYRWRNWSPAALDAFKTAYKQAITTIRSNGLRMPIMIDAPDCGTSVNAFLSVGQELIDHDPLHSILLSAHAYWGGDYNGSGDLDLAIAAKLPIVVGEIANKQFANDRECFYGLDDTNFENPPPTGFRYQSLLINLTRSEVGWLAWAWYKDNCEHRRMTLDGNYTGAIDGSATGLTPYGEDILHHGTYGLRLGYFRPQKLDTLPGAPPV